MLKVYALKIAFKMSRLSKSPCRCLHIMIYLPLKTPLAAWDARCNRELHQLFSSGVNSSNPSGTASPSSAKFLAIKLLAGWWAICLKAFQLNLSSGVNSAILSSKIASFPGTSFSKGSAEINKILVFWGVIYLFNYLFLFFIISIIIYLFSFSFFFFKWTINFTL